MNCPTCNGTMRGKTVNTGKGPRQVFECNQDNGECLNDKGYPTSVWPKGNGARAPQQRSSAPPRPQQRASGGDDRSSRIERQHSQEMALRLATIQPAIITDSGDGIFDLKKLRWFIDWFHKDVSNTPSRPQPQQRAPSPQAQSGYSGEPSQDLGYDPTPPTEGDEVGTDDVPF